MSDRKDKRIEIVIPYSNTTKENFEDFLNSLKNSQHDMYDFHGMIKFFNFRPYVKTLGIFKPDENRDIMTERHYWEWEKEELENCSINDNPHHQKYTLILPYPLLDDETIDDLKVDFFGYAIDEKEVIDMKNKQPKSFEIIFHTEAQAESFIEYIKNNIVNPILLDNIEGLIKIYLNEIIYATQFCKETNGIYGWEKDIFDNVTVKKDIIKGGYIISFPLPTLFENLVNTEEIKKHNDVIDALSYALPIEGIQDSGERISYGEGKAIREPSTGKGRFDLITPFGLARLARWYELGAQKYSDRNWEKGGIPFSRYFDSAMRHMNKYMMGMTDEDHLAAACWNILCMMHHEELGEKELDDLPHYLNYKIELVDEMHNYPNKGGYQE